jgi:hypothetical protein
LGNTSKAANRVLGNYIMEMDLFHTKAHLRTAFHMGWEKLTVKMEKGLMQNGLRESTGT